MEAVAPVSRCQGSWVSLQCVKRKVRTENVRFEVTDVCMLLGTASEAAALTQSRDDDDRCLVCEPGSKIVGTVKGT